jgi:nicotinamide riboside transporter PnuC
MAFIIALIVGILAIAAFIAYWALMAVLLVIVVIFFIWIYIFSYAFSDGKLGMLCAIVATALTVWLFSVWNTQKQKKKARS